jgi:hypothetical protein
MNTEQLKKHLQEQYDLCQKRIEAIMDHQTEDGKFYGDGKVPKLLNEKYHFQVGYRKAIADLQLLLMKEGQ